MTLTLSFLLRIIITLAIISRLFERTLELCHQFGVGLLHLLSELLPTDRGEIKVNLRNHGKSLEHLRLQECIEASGTTGTALTLFTTLSSHGVAHQTR